MKLRDLQGVRYFDETLGWWLTVGVRVDGRWRLWRRRRQVSSQPIRRCDAYIDLFSEEYTIYLSLFVVS